VRSSLFAAALAAGASLAGAQEIARPPELDVVSLQAEASREVENDQLVAVLAAEAHGANPAELAETVNRSMAEALKTARAVPAIRLRTGNYQTFPRYKGQRIDGWTAAQELRLESADFTAAARLIGQLQQSLVVRSMTVRLSPEARRAAEDALMSEAIAAFHARADLARKAMKAGSYRVRNIAIGTSGARMAELSARAMVSQSPVAVEGGVSQVTVTISGSIQLR
jgi:predicted secreted protein